MSLGVFYHFSAKALTLDAIIPTFALEKFDKQGHKPQGLWLSDEDDYGWSRAAVDMFGAQWFSNKEAYRVTVDLEDSILQLSSLDDVKHFTEIYKDDHRLLEMIPEEDREVDSLLALYFKGLGIRWREVAQSYKGMVASPYLGKFGLESGLNWYDQMDCACACVWDPSCIRSLEQVPMLDHLTTALDSCG